MSKRRGWDSLIGRRLHYIIYLPTSMYRCMNLFHSIHNCYRKTTKIDWISPIWPEFESVLIAAQFSIATNSESMLFFSHNPMINRVKLLCCWQMFALSVWHWPISYRVILTGLITSNTMVEIRITSIFRQWCHYNPSGRLTPMCDFKVLNQSYLSKEHHPPSQYRSYVLHRSRKPYKL